jgi:glycosyltransferase involved in cell wall biosynthesis
VRIHLYCLCWNDARILPLFFRHYDSLVDAYTVFDDGSTDGSLEILQAHPKVEVRPFARAHPNSFVLSELYLSNRCWKESRGSADWVIVVDVDEHLFHPHMAEYLQSCKTSGITIVPALGFDMYSPDFPGSHEILFETRTRGAPDPLMSKLAAFQPHAIEEVFFAPGRHWACPTGDVVAPVDDELLLLHYKFPGIEYAAQRHAEERLGLGPLDIAQESGHQYSWSKEELRSEIGKLVPQTRDVLLDYDTMITEYPHPRWWENLRDGGCPDREAGSVAVPAFARKALSSRPQAVTHRPRVSVILPSYNHERFLARALDSILAQTYQDFEIIVTDDGSADRSVDLLRTYERTDERIKLFVNRFNYERHSLNNCVQHSRGDYIAVAHSDDEFAPTKLEQQVNFLDEHRDIAAVFATPRAINELGHELQDYGVFNSINRSRHEWLRHFFLFGNCLCHPSVLMRRSVHDRLGLYNPLLGALDDFDMWVRICLHYDIHVLPDKLVNFRILDWAGNTSGDKPDNFRRGQYEFIKILDHFQSPDALAQLHMIFPEAADRVLHRSDSEKRYALAMMALDTGHLSHRYWGIDLLYQLLSNPQTKSQLGYFLGSAPEADFIRLNGNLNPFTTERRPIAQVLWPVAGVYSELNSRSAYYFTGEWQEVRIPIPAWDTGMPLRVDPCHFACIVNLSAVRIHSRTDGRCLWSAALQEGEAAVTLSGGAVLLSNQDSMLILCTGDDPQIYLNSIPPLPDIPLELQAWLKVEPGLVTVGRELELLRGSAGERAAID